MGEPRSWVLFEDMRAGTADSARSYRDCAGIARCADVAGLPGFFRSIESWHRAGLPVVLVLDYEFGNLLEPAAAPSAPGVCAVALAFRTLRTGSSADLEGWIGRELDRSGEPVDPAGVADTKASIDLAEYRRRFAQVQQYIRDGHTYQINLTFALRFRWFGDPLALYRRLRQRQRVSYGAYIELDGRTLVCLSPELFIRRSGSLIQTRPMKGTRPRGANRQQDALIGEQMKADPKSRAENLMIVDLLRNDLGRICETGSVQVCSLFDLETFDTVLQMTSTIQGRVAPDTGLEAILRAMFPCGSVTGAPKHRSRQIIAQVEARRRGIYTGSIGYLDPDGTLLLNVAIRTLELGADGHGVLGIGGGVVADSTCLDEWNECFVKARFLTESGPGFELIETLGAERREGAPPSSAAELIPRWESHMARLRRSAASFGFVFDRKRIEQELLEELHGLGAGPYRVRLLLGRTGGVSITWQALPPARAGAPMPAIGIAPQAIRSDAWHQAHKTTHRPLYDPALQRAQDEGLWDYLFFNERDELVEGARSSVFLRLDDRLVTPPLESGALPGIERARILADPVNAAVEARITRADLARAQSVYLCNAVRGLFQVRLR